MATVGTLEQPLLQNQISGGPLVTQPRGPRTMQQLAEGLKAWKPNSHTEYKEDSNISCHLCIEESNTLIYGSSGFIKIVNLETKEVVQFTRAEVDSVAISRDNAFLFSGHTNGEIAVWSVEDPTEPLKVLKKHGSKVTFLEVTPDNQHFISCSEDMKIIVWDMDWNEVMSFKDHTAAISCLKVADKFISTGSQDHTVRIWSLEDPYDSKCFTEHKTDINCLEMTSDFSKIVASSYDKEIRVWDTQSKTASGVLIGHSAGVMCLRISPDDKYLISSDLDFKIIIWDFENGQDLCKLDGHSKVIKDIQINEDCNHFATCSMDGSIKLWNLKYYREQGRLEGHQEGVEKLSFLQGKLVSRSSENVIRIWDLKDCSKEKVLKYSEDIKCMATCQKGKQNFLAVGDFKDYSLRIYDIDGSKEPIKQLDDVFDVQIEIMTFSRNGMYLAMACEHDAFIKAVIMEDALATGAPIQPKNTINYPGKLTKMIITNEGIIIAGFADGVIKFWSIPNATSLGDTNTGNIFTTEITSLVTTENNQNLLSGSKDPIILVWDLVTFQVLRTFDYKDSNQQPLITSTRCLLELPGQRFASGSEDSVIRIWSLISELQNTITQTTPAVTPSVPSIQSIVNLQGHTKPISFLQATTPLVSALALDDFFLISASEDLSIKIWDMKTRIELFRLTGHTKLITGMQLNRAGSFLITASNDSSVRIWNIGEKREEIILESHTKEVIEIGVVHDPQTKIGCKIASLSKDQAIKIWTDKQSGILDIAGTGNRIEAFCAMMVFKNMQKITPNQANITISNYRLNFAHHFCDHSKDLLLADALNVGCNIRTDSENTSALRYAINRNSIKCVDVIIAFLANLEDTSRFLANCHAIRDDFNALLATGSRSLPLFLESIFKKCEEDLPNIAVPLRVLPSLNFGISTRINRNEFVYPDKENQNTQNIENTDDDKLIEFRACAIELPVVLGSEQSISMLTAIYECPNTKIYRSQLMRTILTAKWNKVWPLLASITFLLWTNLVLMMFLLSDEHKDSPGIQASYAVILGLLISYEIAQVVCSTGYLKDQWNQLDILMLILCSVWIILMMCGTEGDGFDILTWVTIAISFIRGITGFRIFSMTRFYVKLILQSIKKCWSFIIIFFYSTIAFGVIFSKSGNYSSNSSSIFDYYWKMSFDLNMGAFDSNSNDHLQYICYVLACIINVIIMLNLLISILGDAFDQFQVDSVELDLCEMIEGILEVENLMFWQKGLENQKYIQTCNEVLDEEDQDEWQGKVRAFETKITKFTENVQASYVELKGTMERELRNIKESNRNLEKRIDQSQIAIIERINEIAGPSQGK